ncbi:hypothetical protein [Streptomyces sp. NPDC054804]
MLMEDRRQQDDVPAVRDALMSPRRPSRLLSGPEADHARVRGVRDSRPRDPLPGTATAQLVQARHIRNWLSELERAVPSSSYRRVIYNNVSTILNAAVDDGHLSKNP